MKNMFKLCVLLASFCVSLCTSAQSLEARKKLEAHVEAINKTLPSSTQPGIVYQKEYIDGSSLFEVIEIDENYASLALLSKRKNTMRRTLLKRYGIEPVLISIAQLAVECDMDIVYLYVSKQSGKSFLIKLPRKDLAKCFD